MSENNISIDFYWETYRPDQREFRQHSIELSPLVGDGKSMARIRVDIPVKHEYLANCEEIIKAQLANDKEPTPILTIAGMKYIQDQFDTVLLPAQTTSEPDVEDEDWGETEKVEATRSPDDDWAEESKSDDEPWDESKEDWGEDK